MSTGSRAENYDIVDSVYSDVVINMIHLKPEPQKDFLSIQSQTLDMTIYVQALSESTLSVRVLVDGRSPIYFQGNQEDVKFCLRSKIREAMVAPVDMTIDEKSTTRIL